MGHLKQKYTKEYFTGQNDQGEKLNYGVEGYDAFLQGHIREIDLSVLEKINFQGKDVLEFGFGLGEAIKYGIEHGAKNYVAVDFASSAKKIAADFLKSANIKGAKLYCDDALSFLKKYIKDLKTKNDKFDIILMFDFVEHVPREELKELFTLLKKIIKNTTIIAINTPNFRYDNDVIKDGLDERNNIDTIDTSDLNDATGGMHCNKYSTVSLQGFMKKLEYLNITEQHFFIPFKINKYHEYKSYKSQWENCYLNNFPITKDYVNDTLEIPNKLAETPEWHNFSQGILQNIDLYLTKTYLKDAFPGGNYDKELFNDFKQSTNHKEIVFDVGGFMGIDSLIFAKIIGPKGKITAFEPNPFNLNRILLNFSQNSDQSKNLSVFNLALGEKIGKAEFMMSNSVDNGYSSTSRLQNTHTEHSTEHLENLGFFSQPVNLDTFDNFLDQIKIYPDVLKIDIEGAEHLFLLGAKEFLKNYSPVLYIELHSQFCALVCTEILSSLGYENSILFEEPDHRLFVKYYKNKNIKLNPTQENNLFESEKKIMNNTIRRLQLKIDKDDRKISEDDRKIKEEMIEIAKLSAQNNDLVNKVVDTQKSLNRLLNNHFIKPQLTVYSFVKKYLIKKS